MGEADRLQFFLKENSVYVVPVGQDFNDAALKQSDFVFVDKIHVQESEDEEERLKWEKIRQERAEDLELLGNVYDTVTETTRWYIYYNREP